MRHVIESDMVKEIDYLIGDDAYKQDWMPLRRERHGLIAFNPRSLRGLLEAGKHFAGRLIKGTGTQQNV
jgi:CelD/BcsL family acetyltransferase involved in cellulose biosynthesis